MHGIWQHPKFALCTKGRRRRPSHHLASSSNEFWWHLVYEDENNKPHSAVWVIGIDHDTVCAGVVGTATRPHVVPDSSTNHDSTDRISGQFIFYHDQQWKLAFSTSCTALRPHRHFRNDAWQRDSQWRHNWYVTSQSTGQGPRAQR